MTIIHEAYLFRPREFAREILPYAKALAQSPDGEKLLLETVIERFENSSRISWLASEYGGWDASYLYEERAEAERGGHVDVGQLLAFMVYGHIHPVPRQFGLIGHWQLMKKVLAYPMSWHYNDTTLLIHGHSFGYFAQLWLADELASTNSTGNHDGSYLGHWENVKTGSTAAQIGWLDYPDVRRFLDKLTRDEPKLPNEGTPNDASSLRQAYENALQMLRSASKAECGLCIITSG